AYLGEDVLKNTGSAVVWWLARAKDDMDVRAAVDLIGALRQLSAAANNSEVPELALPPIAELTAAPAPALPPADLTIADQARRMMDSLNLDEPARVTFVRRLAKVLTGTGRQDAADDLLATFDPPPEPEEPPPGQDPPTEGELPVASAFDLPYGVDLPRVTDLPPEPDLPDWVEPPRNGVADTVPEWADESDRTARPDPSGVDSQ
ncbi:MAG TPA: hypothetical protein VH333_06665, partial [Pseudonocardiaceae bacterium]|nr:hypothetical protein [Pseudonocardiaceae bacterium]